MIMRRIFASIAASALFQPLAASEIKDREGKENNSHKDENYVSHWIPPNHRMSLGLRK
jgi:hypothetical protein